ncbi:MAG TPA: molybdate ABC transporter substrate-binding protein [Gemmatimonadaceae bacterium]|nr:molybdate ABC transporter substrate-binding protein [Gemmatimonadaceae bacterium]
MSAALRISFGGAAPVGGSATHPAAAAVVTLVVALVAACGGRASSGSAAARTAGDTVRVAVAANFTAPHDTIARHFTDSTGVVVVTTVGATGQLYAQVMNGAPFDVLLAADTLRPALLEANGAGVRGTRFTYAAGRLALYAPTQPALVDSPERLTASAIRHVAVADSAAAPYGAAALQVLARWNVAARIAPRLVHGESIAQTFQFVSSGAAEAGFVALSQVIRLGGARYYVVPDSLHDRIGQDAVLLSRATRNAAARRYLEYLRSAPARAVIESFGYAVPQPAPPPR